MPRPRGGDWLEDEIAEWREAGLDVVVLLLTPDEVDHFDLEAEKPLCEAHEIRFVSFPIPDRGVPASKDAAIALINDLEQSLADGKNVVVHCRQGIGRSGLIAACLLVSGGQKPRSAFEDISKARGVIVPETAEQEQWLIDRASALALHPAV